MQIGLLDPVRRQTPVPMDLIIARELELCGSHGMQAHRYPAMLRMIEQGHLHPDKLIARTIRLDQATEALPSMNEFRDPGITMITSFT